MIFSFSGPGLDDISDMGQVTIILTGIVGNEPVRFPARAEDGKTELHLRVQLKDLLTLNRTTELADPSHNPWTITLPNGGSSQPVRLVGTDNKSLTVTFRKD